MELFIVQVYSLFSCVCLERCPKTPRRLYIYGVRCSEVKAGVTIEQEVMKNITDVKI